MALTKNKIAKMLGNTTRTVENWEKEGRPIIAFVKRYLNSDEKVEEFLRTGKVAALEEFTVREGLERRVEVLEAQMKSLLLSQKQGRDK